MFDRILDRIVIFGAAVDVAVPPHTNGRAFRARPRAALRGRHPRGRSLEKRWPSAAAPSAAMVLNPSQWQVNRDITRSRCRRSGARIVSACGFGACDVSAAQHRAFSSPLASSTSIQPSSPQSTVSAVPSAARARMPSVRDGNSRPRSASKKAAADGEYAGVETVVVWRCPCRCRRSARPRSARA